MELLFFSALKELNCSVGSVFARVPYPGGPKTCGSGGFGSGFGPGSGTLVFADPGCFFSGFRISDIGSRIQQKHQKRGGKRINQLS
jgi:hypothetical protein